MMSKTLLTGMLRPGTCPRGCPGAYAGTEKERDPSKVFEDGFYFNVWNSV